MPAISSPVELLENVLVQRSTNSISPNATAQVLEVVCAWPVSGQYGPGTRVLYYALMAACVLARRTEWIRSACLAAVLLFPAIAALHGIVLAALHRHGAVDMDVYGAFQLCAIGILTAPVTVRLSQTYFNNPGRDIIFLWTGLLLAGLLSLTVEFIRLKPTHCPPDDPATIEWAQTGQFSYKSNCSMVCGEKGPFSPLRQGAASNIYVIPVPYELTFNTATLLAAACCIPAILSLVSTWIKILERNWERLSRKDQPHEKPDEQPITGTNGATPKQMTWISERVRSWLTLIEIPVFVAAVLAILVKGEMNFFSKPVRHQTEPIASVGQWAPIVGTGLAVVGSLYLLLAADMEAEKNEEDQSAKSPNIRSVERCARCDRCILPDEDADSDTNSRRSSQSSGEPISPGMARTVTQPSVSTTMGRTITNQSKQTTHSGGRRKVARFFNGAVKQIAVKAHTKFEGSGFNDDERTTFPEVPGEPFRNPDLPMTIRAYSNSPVPRSTASSFVEIGDSDSTHGEGNSRTLRGSSRLLSLPVTPPARAVTRQTHANTLPSRGSSSEATGQQGFGILHGGLSAQPWSSPGGSRPDQENGSEAPSISEISPNTLTPGSRSTPPEIVISRG